MTVDLDHMKRTLAKKSGVRDSLWPSSLLTVYSEQPLAVVGPAAAAMLRRYLDEVPPKVLVGPAAAAMLRRYLDEVPPKVLRSTAIRDDVGKLTSAKLKRDLASLEKPKKGDYREYIYMSADGGLPGDYGIHWELGDTADELYAGEAVTLKFEFPWRIAEGEGEEVEQHVNRLVRILGDFPLSAAVAGFGFSLWQADHFAWDQLIALLPRYQGFDLSLCRVGEWMGDCTPVPGWITWLSKSMMQRLGGDAALAEAAPEAQVSRLPCGVMIRAAKRPPIGDVNRAAPDIGQIPGVARFTKAERMWIPNDEDGSLIHGREARLDSNAWLRRFDEYDNRPWDNR